MVALYECHKHGTYVGECLECIKEEAKEAQKLRRKVAALKAVITKMKKEINILSSIAFKEK